jgi:uncharacterized protein (TIRG00374 family)
MTSTTPVKRPVVGDSPGLLSMRRPGGIHLPRWLTVGGSVVILGLTVWFVVVPQFAAAGRSLSSLERLALPLVIAAIVLELASLAAYSIQTAIVLGRPRPSYSTLLLIDLTDLGVNHVVPGGGATSGALRLQLFDRIGISPARGFTAATVEITESNLLLGVVFGVGVALSLSTFAGNTLYAIAAIAVLVLLAAAAAGAWMLVRRTNVAVRWLRALARPVPFISQVGLEAFVRAMALQVRSLATDRRRVVQSVVVGILNWVLDAAALWVVFAAFGHPIAPGTLLTVYSLGSILAMLPLTPGGLGIVEGVMVPAFVAFGIPAPVALLGVVGWRLLQYWMPIPLSLVAYSFLRLGPLRNRTELSSTAS